MDLISSISTLIAQGHLIHFHLLIPKNITKFQFQQAPAVSRLSFLKHIYTIIRSLSLNYSKVRRVVYKTTQFSQNPMSELYKTRRKKMHSSASLNLCVMSSYQQSTGKFRIKVLTNPKSGGKKKKSHSYRYLRICTTKAIKSKVAQSS